MLVLPASSVDLDLTRGFQTCSRGFHETVLLSLKQLSELDGVAPYFLNKKYVPQVWATCPASWTVRPLRFALVPLLSRARSSSAPFQGPAIWGGQMGTTLLSPVLSDLALAYLPHQPCPIRSWLVTHWSI